MGANKLLYTERHSGNSRALPRLRPEERDAWRALIRGGEYEMENRRIAAARRAESEAPTGALESIDLALDYTGAAPTVAGRYLVVDLLTETQRVVVVTKGPDGSREARADASQPRPLADFLKGSQRWFLVPRLDLDAVRGLPAA